MLSALDGGLIATALVGACVGWGAGFFLAAGYIAAGAAGGWAAANYADSLAFYISGRANVAWVLIFVGVTCIGAAAVYFLNSLTALPLVRLVNKISGAALGAAAGVIVAAAALFPFLMIHSPAFKPLAEKSRLTPVVDRCVERVLHEWPAQFKKNF